MGIWGIPGFTSFLSKYFSVIALDDLYEETFDVESLDKRTPHILILDGYFSKDQDDLISNLLKDLVVVSRAVILLGNEAAYSSTAQEGFMDLESELLNMVEKPYIRIPGAPASALHLLGTLNHLIYDLPDLDEYRRPLMFFSKRICDQCEFRGDFEEGRFVKYYGQKEGCLYLLGCKGPVTRNSCPKDRWNGSANWCVAAGSPCTGCTEPGFPAHSGLGLFGQLASDKAAINSFLVRNSGTIVQGTVAVTLAGIASHTISKKTMTPVKIKTISQIEEEG
jgi:NiFe hydrogenase small subunit HydA